MTVSNDLSLLLEAYRFEVNYVDYPEDTFTVPVILTSERAKKIIEDKSVRKVRFHKIIGDQMMFTFEHKDLTMSTVTHVSPNK